MARLDFDDSQLLTTLSALRSIARVDPMAFEYHQRAVIAEFIVKDLLKGNRVCVSWGGSSIVCKRMTVNISL